MMTNTILIYGDDFTLMRKAAADRKAKDHTLDIRLRRVMGFTPEKVMPCKEVVIIGHFPDIADAYAGKTKVTLRDDPDDDKPALVKSTKKFKPKDEA